MKTALLTRPAGEAAEATKARLAAMGWAALHEPMTRIELIDAPLPEGLARAQAIAFTSRNGVEIFARRCALRDAKVYAVGAATAAAARAAGFGRVESAEADGAALARLLAARLDPAGGPLWHFSGEEAAFDVASALRAAGFPAERRALYRAAPAPSLSQGAASALEAGRIDAILIYAPSAARVLAALLGNHPGLSRVDLAAISPAAAEPCRAMGARRILTAERPDEPSLLGLLRGLSDAG